MLNYEVFITIILILKIFSGDLELHQNQLTFLGLFGTIDDEGYDVCQRKKIPAKYVSGNANGKQMLISLKKYAMRPTMLVDVLKELEKAFSKVDRISNIQVQDYLKIKLDLKLSSFVDLMLETRFVMMKHLSSVTIQFLGSSVLLRCSRIIRENNLIGDKTVELLREGIIRTTFDMLLEHIADESVVKIGFQILNHYWSENMVRSNNINSKPLIAFNQLNIFSALRLMIALSK